MQPIFHISLGRSGTTLAMRLLASHPQVIAHEAYPLEFRPAWSAVRSDDDVCRNELIHPHYHFDGWDETIGQALSKKGRLDVNDALATYSRLSQVTGKNAVFFAEKAVWRHVSEIAAAYPDARFSCTIRDPRDLLVSVRAFNAKRGFQAFLAKEEDSDETIVSNYLHAYDTLIETIDAVGTAVIRYEDLFTSPVDTIVRLYTQLGLDASEKIARKAWKRAHFMEDGRHRTSQAGSLERWRQELPLQLQRLYLDRLGHVLARFSYPLH